MKNFEEVKELISTIDEKTNDDARKFLDNLAKPLGSLGKLEEIAVQLAGIRGHIKSTSKKKGIIIMCADNGVFEEGVSSCPQYITLMQSVNFVKGLTGVCAVAKIAGADIFPIDIGINSDFEYEGLLNKKIRKGTSNFTMGSAMMREEAIRAIEIGIDVVEDLEEKGYDLLGTGEMGIGNTSTSSAILMAFTGCSTHEAVGKGAGLTEEGFINKKKVIEKALEVNEPDKDDPIDVLAKLGGFDIAGLVGCFLGAAYKKIPIVIDGFISAVAAFTAYKINPLTVKYMIPSHKSMERGFNLIMEELKLSPMLDLDMRLGEGSGCPIAFKIIEAAESVVNNMATFEEASIVNDYLIDIREEK